MNLVRDKETGKSKGFAFLKYEDQRSTDLAVDNLGGAKILDRILRVDHTRYKKREKRDGEQSEEEDNVKVGKKPRLGDDQRRTSRERPTKRERDLPSRPLLKEETELAALLRDHDEEDPMKEYLIQEKKEEVDKALRRLEKEKHRHRRRSGERAESDDDRSRRRQGHRHRHRDRSQEDTREQGRDHKHVHRHSRSRYVDTGGDESYYRTHTGPKPVSRESDADSDREDRHRSLRSRSESRDGSSKYDRIKDRRRRQNSRSPDSKRKYQESRSRQEQDEPRSSRRDYKPRSWSRSRSRS